MVKKNQKKAGVEMSLNLIILLIIGMVVLGLVIGFVSKLVNDSKAKFDTEISKNDQVELDAIAGCPDNLCISPSPTITVVKGKKTNIFIKVRAFSDEINCDPGALGADFCKDLTFEVKEEDGESITTVSTPFAITGPGLSTNVGEENSQMYTLKADSSLSLGTYFVTFTLTPGIGEEKATKTVTIIVK